LKLNAGLVVGSLYIFSPNPSVKETIEEWFLRKKGKKN